MAAELKVISDTGNGLTIGGYAAIFGGADAVQDRFTAATDFWLDQLGSAPVLYQHGQDPMLKKQPIGRVTSTRIDDVGLWVTAQLQASKAYLEAIRDLIAKGIIGLSIGSAGHLVQRVKSSTPGVMEITSFPMVELSLTPTPAEYRTLGVKELKSLAAADPLLLPIAREAEKAQQEAKVAVSDLPDSAFAFIASGGTLDDEKKTFPRASRLYPHHDEHGLVDPDSLASSMAAAKSGEHIEAIAHLMRHAHAADTGSHDDAHEPQWSEGAAPALLVASAKMAALAEDIASDRLAMERLHMDTKKGRRINAAVRDELKAIYSSIGYLREDADSVERGDDGTAQVESLRLAFELLDLEEAA